MPEVRFVGHHLAHATIAFHASDFEEAAVLVIDGNGDDESISIYRAERDRPLVRKRVWPRSHSLGYMYDAACRFVGFGPLQAGKLMGLSAYGRAAGAEPWDLLPDGDPAAPVGIDEGDGFNRYLHAWTAQLDRLAGGRRVGRARHELQLDELAVQVAVSAQEAVERTVLKLAALARELTGTENLCLAGGVALNCKANGLLSGPVFAPPAPHDAGTALGAAWHVAPPRRAAAGRISAFLGPSPATAQANGALDGLHREALSLERVCAAMQAGRIGAIVEGPGEIGPRALGHRSIIADPQRPRDAGAPERAQGARAVAAVRRRRAALARRRPVAAAAAAVGLHARRHAGLGRRLGAAAGRRPRRRDDAPAGARPGSGDLLPALLGRVGRARRRRAHQHVVQRAGRADRVERRRRGRLLPAASGSTSSCSTTSSSRATRRGGALATRPRRRVRQRRPDRGTIDPCAWR